MLVPGDWWGKHVGLVAGGILFHRKDCSPAVDKYTAETGEALLLNGKLDLGPLIEGKPSMIWPVEWRQDLAASVLKRTDEDWILGLGLQTFVPGPPSFPDPGLSPSIGHKGVRSALSKLRCVHSTQNPKVCSC